MTTISLVRHGETDWNKEGKLQGREDIELNDYGRMQAKSCADYLKEFSWDLIVTSPLKRAKESAQIICESIGHIPIIEIDDLIERDYGKASGLTIQQREIMFPDGNIPEQEDWDTLKNRVMKTLKNIVYMNEGMRIIVVSHGGVIRCILSEITDGDNGIGKTKLKNACINMILHNGSDWKLELYNHTVHDV